MAGWHHRLDGHELEQTPGHGEGQGSLHAAVRGVSKELGRCSPQSWTRLSDRIRTLLYAETHVWDPGILSSLS